MFDPYAHRTYGPGDPANDLFLVTHDDAADIQRGVKALRIWNPEATASTVKVTTLAGNDVTITVPPTSLIVERLRIKRVWNTGTTATVVIHGYTDSDVVTTDPA